MADKKEEGQKETVVLSAVLYVDGSALNNGDNKGVNGSGIHGFIYNANDTFNKTSNKHSKYVITKDGYLEKSVATVTKAKEVNPISYVDIIVTGGDAGTNNTAELDAVIEALKYATHAGIDKLLLKSDSTYTIDVFNNCQKISTDRIWLEIDKNADRWVEMKKAVESFVGGEENGKALEIRKVKAHDVNLGNNIADRLAFVGRYRHTEGDAREVDVKVSDPKRYWKPAIERNPLLQARRYFFLTGVDDDVDGYSVYKTFDYKNIEDTGKLDNAARCGYVFTKTADPDIENIKTTLSDAYSDTCVVAVVFTDKLFKPDNYRLINTFGNKVLTISNKQNIAITVMGEDVVGSRLYPPGQAKHAIDNDFVITNILSNYAKYAKSEPEESKSHIFVDITDGIYATNEKGKKVIRKEIDDTHENTTFDIEIAGGVASIPVTIGTDTLARNQLKKLETNDTKVILVIEPVSNNFFKYYTIVDVRDTGDIGVFYSYYANEVIIHKK